MLIEPDIMMVSFTPASFGDRNDTGRFASVEIFAQESQVDLF